MWRVRKQFDQMDAILVKQPDHCQLRYLLNGQPLTSRDYDNETAAVDAAIERLKELERVGWYTHW